MKGRHPCLPRPTGILLVDGITDGDKLEALSAEVRPGVANGWKPNLRSRSPTRGLPLSNLIFSLRFHHFQEALRGILDIGIAVLMGAALHRQQCATMDVFEIAKWKFESRLAVLNMRRVDPEMPL